MHGGFVIARADVCWVSFDPVQGGEAQGRRPALVVSSDQMNRPAQTLGRGVIIVVPLTTNVHRVYPFQLLIDPDDVPGLPAPSKAQFEQLRAVDVRRLAGMIGRLPDRLEREVDARLRMVLEPN